ncbi:hypothetical protein ACT3TN_03875 [Psychrobacter sp. AOP1-A1-57]|uniref:hypothetical protein n=1 Tax=Psychrobacter sp. AOP1-A1-57 TaxID=3457728 RepID=UPI00403706B3
MHQSFYLFSSFMNNPDFYFDGYCFVNSDYIFGEGGARKYIFEKNERILGGEDGCYFVSYLDKGRYVFSNDYAGYKKILYYYNPILKVWAVSNSLYALVSHLREEGINITPNLSQLYFHSKNKKSFAQQLTSFNTIANGIYALPTNTNLVIDRYGMRINSNAKKMTSVQSDYKSVLANFVSIWVSRFATIFSQSDIYIRQALTGGLDSRAVFSLTALAKKYLGGSQTAQHSFICNKTRGDNRDIDVAEEICNYYGYPLNSKVSQLEYRYIGSKDTYDRWKHLSLGIYFPMYFDARSIDPLNINISGGGGEKYRPFYRTTDEERFEDFCSQQVSRVDRLVDQMEVKSNILNSMSTLRKGKNDPFQIHYTEFRNRFHSGLFPQHIVDISPLNSYLLATVASDFQDSVKGSQLLYDLINLEKNALEFRFDDLKKAPTNEHIGNLTILDDFDINIEKGNMYLDKKSLISISKSNETYTNSHLTYLENDLYEAYNDKFIQSIWSKQFLKNVDKDVEKILANNKLAHASEGLNISCFLASSIFSYKGC